MKRLVRIVISLMIVITAVLPLVGIEARSRDNESEDITIEAYNKYSYSVPVACFNWTPLYPKAGQTITFDASCSYDPDGTIEEYSWSYTTVGSPHWPVAMGHGKILEYFWDNQGEYDVTLQVASDKGSVDSITKPVSVTKVKDIVSNEYNELVLLVDDSKDLPCNSMHTTELNFDTWVRIISPNGGEQWQVGKNHIIYWDYEAIFGCYERFNIYYKKKGEIWRNIVSDVVVTSYSWDTGSISDGFYKIKVELWCDPDFDGHGDLFVAHDTSDNWFNIKPKSKDYFNENLRSDSPPEFILKNNLVTHPLLLRIVDCFLLLPIILHEVINL